MTNEERNTALYQKMFAEQENFRDWLKSQPPEEILNHAYEYTIREDILLSLEYNDLSDAQVDALMQSPCPLADVLKDFEKLETDHMEDIWNCLEARADKLLENQRRALRERSSPQASGFAAMGMVLAHALLLSEMRPSQSCRWTVLARMYIVRSTPKAFTTSVTAAVPSRL